jgi:integrase
MNNPAFTGMMDAKTQTYEKYLGELGASNAVDLFLSKYGNLNTRVSYAGELVFYLRWLRDAQGVTMSPDDLVLDNLRAVYESKPVDVTAKRKHNDWLNEYVNHYLLDRGLSESKRHLALHAVRQFYQKNDSSLFGDYSLASQPLREPAPPLFPEDIRKVLLAMPVRTRAPLLLAWQTGIEINRLLGLNLAPNGSAHLKIPLLGRKGHRKAYWTYAGADSVEILKTVGGRGFVGYDSLADTFKGTAIKLGAQGLLKNADRRSWHPHALRHSFSTECKAARVDNEVREFFLGHVSGISYVYQHQEIHEEDILAEYAKVEPLVSLNPDEASIRQDFAKREKEIRSEFEALRQNFEELQARLLASGTLRSSPQPRP